MVYIMPHIEQDSNYRPIANSVETYLTTGSSTWRSVRGIKIPYFRCPTDTGLDVNWTSCEVAACGRDAGSLAADRTSTP